MKSNEDYVNYEYHEVVVPRRMLDRYLDDYPNFGWVIIQQTAYRASIDRVLIKMKRNRNINNKAELRRLQSKFEFGIDQLKKLHVKQVLTATIMAMLIGVLGTCLVGIGYLAYQNSGLTLALVIGVPGIVLWTLPPIIKRRMVANAKRRLESQFNQVYDVIDETCKKAHRLF